MCLFKESLSYIEMLIIVLLLFGVVSAFTPNLKYFEGDLILSPEQRKAIIHATNNANQFAAIRSKVWPSSRIAWDASKEILSNDKAMKAINAAFADYHAKTCLKFHRRANEKSYLYFYEGDGCHSRVGYFGVNRISLASQCQHKGTVIHEMYHSLGFYHEQSRPDRDQYVKIHWERIRPSARSNYQKYKRSIVYSMGVPYDYLSVSHYRKDQYASGVTQIETLDKKYKDIIGTTKELSVLDVKQLSLMYRCDGQRTLPPTLTPPTEPPQVCEDENGLSYCTPLVKWCQRSSLKNILKQQCFKSCGYC